MTLLHTTKINQGEHPTVSVAPSVDVNVYNPNSMVWDLFKGGETRDVVYVPTFEITGSSVKELGEKIDKIISVVGNNNNIIMLQRENLSNPGSVYYMEVGFYSYNN